jgi:hypothetical protein
VKAGPPLGKASERICFAVAALAILAAAQVLLSAGFTEECLAGLATAAAFGFAGGFLRHRRLLAEFKRGYPGWPEFGHIRRRRK